MELVPNLPTVGKVTAAERLLRLEGKPFSLHNGYELYQAIYNYPFVELLLKNARQTGKSQTIANFMALDTATTPYHKSFYLSPSQNQTTRFSHTKLGKVLSGSPVIKGLVGGAGVNNVYLRILRNQAEQILSYASDDPDRIRGITSDDNYYDEIQDMDLMAVRSVSDNTTDSSPNPRFVMSGTPKSVENPLEDSWIRSSQTEPLIRCHGCNKWNKPSIKNIGLKGFICASCSKLLNVQDFMWYDFNKKFRIKGFHIPQIVLPFHVNNPAKWDLLLDRFENWPESKFKNEVMAESDSTGTRFLTREDLENCCGDYKMSAYPTADIKHGIDFTVAGVDWSGGGKDGTSRTVIHVWGCMPDLTIKTLFYKVYPTEDPVNSVSDITALCERYSVRLVIGDQGEGSLANGLLADKLGKHRVGKFRYGSFSKACEIDTITGVYKIDKTTMIDNYFTYIKSKATIFPYSVDSRVAFDDVMNEFSEVTNTGKKIWTHGLSRPDDCLHAQIGGWLAMKLLKRDLTFY